MKREDWYCVLKQFSAMVIQISTYLEEGGKIFLNVEIMWAWACFLRWRGRNLTQKKKKKKKKKRKEKKEEVKKGD